MCKPKINPSFIFMKGYLEEEIILDILQVKELIPAVLCGN